MRTLAGMFLLIAFLGLPGSAMAAKLVEPAYGAQKVVFDFYFDDPAKLGPALHWVRSWMNPLTTGSYGYAPEELHAVVVVHGTEIVALATKNYARYRAVVDRMRYYADLGVKFRVCALAAADYGYRPADFQDFVEVVPSAFAELAHWQMQGYALITPRILERKYTIEEIR